MNLQQTQRTNWIARLELTADDMVEVDAQLLVIAVHGRVRSAAQLEVLMTKKQDYERAIDAFLRSEIMTLFQE